MVECMSVSQTRPVWDCQDGLPRNGQGGVFGGSMIGQYASPMECLGMKWWSVRDVFEKGASLVGIDV